MCNGHFVLDGRKKNEEQWWQIFSPNVHLLIVQALYGSLAWC